MSEMPGFDKNVAIDRDEVYKVVEDQNAFIELSLPVPTAFGLPAAGVPDPVKGQVGTVVADVDAIAPGATQPFAAVAPGSLDVGRVPVAAHGEAEAVELTSNGPPIPGIEIAIGGEDIATAPDTAVGEILLRGPFVFDGYFDAPGLTAAAFRDDWYKTGDIGFLRGGELFICGRLKELVIVNGRNFYCHDIEAAASSVPGVAPGRALAIGVEPGDAGEQVLILAETLADAPDAITLARAIKARVFDALELMPQKVELVPRGWLVKTTSGKLSRSENLRRLRERG